MNLAFLNLFMKKFRKAGGRQVRSLRLRTGSERIDDPHRSVSLPIGQVL